MDLIGDIVESDAALSSKLLQLVNSAFFGLGRRVASAAEAATLLGFSTLRSVALAIGALEPTQASDSALNLKLAELRTHSLLTAEVARTLAAAAGLSAHQAFTLGVLHDIGDLILATTKTKLFDDSRSPDSAAVGSYLLGVWGLPISITEAVANHHRPRAVEHDRIEQVDILHVSGILASAAAPNPFENACDVLDLEHLYSHDFTAGQWEDWKAQAAVVIQNCSHLPKVGS